MFRRRARDDRGAAAVEFALVMLPLLYLVFGIIQYGLYFYASNAGTNAVGDAVRRLSVGDCQTTSDLRTFLKTRLGGATGATASGLTFLNGSGATASGPIYLDTTGSPVASPGSVGGRVMLSVRFPAVNMHFPFVPLPNSGSVTRTVYARIEDTVQTGGNCV